MLFQIHIELFHFVPGFSDKNTNTLQHLNVDFNFQDGADVRSNPEQYACTQIFYYQRVDMEQQ